MKRYFWLLLLAAPALAEPPSTGGEGAAVTCSDGEILKATSGVLGCAADATGGSPSFDLVATGTNTAATMTCNTGCTIDGNGTLSMVPATATALAANPADCSANQFANAIAASGDLTCAALTDADVPNTITVDLAAAATALAANGANCSAGSAPLGVDASGAAETCTDYEEDLANSAGLAAALSDETGSGAAVFGTSPLISTPNIRGVYDLTGTAVDDDDCTGQQGSGWWDSTDLAWEFCNANSGAPATLDGGGLANVVEDTTPQLGGSLDVNDQAIVNDGANNEVLVEETVLTVRQPAGVAGTDDLDLSHDGTDATVRSQSGKLWLQTSADSINLQPNAEAALTASNDGTNSTVTVTGDSTQQAAVNIFEVENSASTVLWGVQGDGDLMSPSGTKKVGVGSTYWEVSDTNNRILAYPAGVLRWGVYAVGGHAYMAFIGGTAGSDTPTIDTTITAADANAAATVNQDGADIVLEPGANATGGGTDGFVVARQPGGVAGTDDLRLSHDGTDGTVSTASGDLSLAPAANLVTSGIRIETPDGETCADSGDGNPGALTLDPSALTSSNVHITNSDANGCTVTWGETGAVSGMRIRTSVISNAGGTVDFSDTAGVSETEGALALSIWDNVEWSYDVDRWVQSSPMVNN